MPERSSLRSLLLAALVAGTVGVGACTEQFDGGDACPSLCPSRPTEFRDTIIEAVTLDTTVGGFPPLGLSATLLVANRPDTLVTRGVIRMDALPTAFRPNNGTDTASITAIDSVYLRLPLDSTGRRGTTPVTLEVFDVDTTASDSVQAVVRSLFRADRRLGSVTFTPSATRDSLRIPLLKERVLAKIRNKQRLRLGLAISGGAGQLRIVAFQLGIAGAPSLLFDATTDTIYAPTIVNPNNSAAGLTDDMALAYQVYGITDVGSPPPPANTLAVGGFPAYRSYLRFAIPARISDSATIVRAELLLTQKPSRFANAGDSVSIVPLVPTSSDAVTDFRRILDLAAEGAFAALDTTRFVPRDSGVRSITVLSVVRSWVTLPANVPRALAFRIGGEGAQAAELQFYSSEAPAALRPRLRITYLPRTENALP